MTTAPSAIQVKRARRTLVLLALVCLAPVTASYVAYYWLRPEARTNYGELVEPRPAPELRGNASGGTPFSLAELRGRWLLIAFAGTSCDDRCQRELYATRQARTMQGREQERVLRILLQPAGSPDPAPEWLASQTGLMVAKGPSAAWTPLAPSGDVRRHIFLVDPLGNVVLRYTDDPDIKRLSQDLARLLRASRIG